MNEQLILVLFEKTPSHITNCVTVFINKNNKSCCGVKHMLLKKIIGKNLRCRFELNIQSSENI